MFFKKPQEAAVNGFLIVDKPSGMTSHDVVSVVRKKFNMKRVGHAGTLDPLATGVLILLLGKATKLFNKFSSFDKAYEATMLLGTSTDTADIEGKIIEKNSFEGIDQNGVEETFAKFVGDIEQIPPMVSAIKVKGKRLYKLARQGIAVEREARKIRIDALKLMHFSLPEVKFYLECSKGTYVRQIAEDVGKLLGCGACISQIRRTQIGRFHISQATPLEEINASHIRYWQD